MSDIERAMGPIVMLSIILLALSFTIGLYVGASVGASDQDRLWRNQAIEKGVGEYNPITGAFELKHAE